MAAVSFHLRNPKAAEPTPVFMSLYADNKQTKIKTGLRVDPKQWSFDEQRCKTRGRGVPQSNGQTNADLERLAAKAIAYYGAQRAAGTIPTGADIWDAVRPRATNNNNGPQPLEDFAAYLLRLRRALTPNTIKAKRTTYNHLRDYVATTGKGLAYADFTREWRGQFADYLSDVVGLSDMTLAKVLGVLRTFLAHAHEQHSLPRPDFTGWAWKYREPDVVPLTAEELAAIEGLVGLSEDMANTRDLFLLMCYTGLRYSDAVRLKPGYDKGDHLLLTAEKTDEVLTIYVRRKLRPILDRYWAGQIFRVRNWPLNQRIRALAKMAGVDAPTEYVRYYGQTSQPVREILPKYELLGCHTGRRTFVTLSLAADAPADVVMQATGHKDHRTLQRYNKTTAARQVAAMRRVLGEDAD